MRTEHTRRNLLRGAAWAPAQWGLIGGLVTAPARALDTITLWGTGFGPANPAVAPGEAVANGSPLLNPVKIRIGQSDSLVAYAGITGAGLYQFNVAVPDPPSGDYPLIAEVAGVRTPPWHACVSSANDAVGAKRLR